MKTPAAYFPSFLQRGPVKNCLSATCFRFTSLFIPPLSFPLSFPFSFLFLSVFYIAPVQAQSASPAIVMKMADYMDSMVDKGVAKLHELQAHRPADTDPAAPTVTRLKMDKINSRFVEKQDVIYDRVNNLTWTRCSLGQHWANNKGCVGKVRQLTFDQAQQRVNEQWRIPTTAELKTLIDRTKKNAPDSLTIDSVAFPDMDLSRLMYWSSDEENNSFAWAVLFIDTGIPAILYRSHRYALRMVRSGI